MIPCFDRKNVSYQDVYNHLIRSHERWINLEGYHSDHGRPLSTRDLREPYEKAARLNAARLIKEHYLNNK